MPPPVLPARGRTLAGVPTTHFRVCCSKCVLPVPYVPSETRSCADCAGEVWYDPASSVTPGGQGELIICMECFEIQLRKARHK